jgi:hypothetical protein
MVIRLPRLGHFVLLAGVGRLRWRVLVAPVSIGQVAHNMRLLLMPIVLCCVTLAGCAPQRPDRTEIFIETAPPGAACTLTRDGLPVASVSPTPGIAWVPRGGSNDITVNCRRDGYREVSAVTHSHASGGLVVHYDYDSPISLSLERQ